jgi:hypothetical protein
MEKFPSAWTIVLTGWLGFMFATAVAALIPSLQLLTAPILCHAPYGHGVVHVHGYSYGTTSGYSIFLRCANAQHQEKGTSIVAVVGLLWLLGWAAALAVRGVYYWTKFLIKTGVDAYWRRRLPPPPVRARPSVATPESLLGKTPATRSAAAAAPGARPSGGAVLVNGRWVARGPDPIDQLARLADLHDRGVLTDTEFAAEKARLLAQS